MRGQWGVMGAVGGNGGSGAVGRSIGVMRAVVRWVTVGCCSPPELRMGLTEELSVGTEEQRGETPQHPKPPTSPLRHPRPSWPSRPSDPPPPGYGRLPLAAVAFHSSVDLEEFEQERVLRVTPGPGEVWGAGGHGGWGCDTEPPWLPPPR